MVNTLRPRQNGRHFAEDIFKCVFLNESVWIPIEISLKLVPKGPINNIPALVQIVAWRRPGDKPLSEPMMVSLPMHICITRPQWVNDHVNHRNHHINGLVQERRNSIALAMELRLSCTNQLTITFQTRELHKLFTRKEEVDFEQLVYMPMDLNIIEEKTKARRYKYLHQFQSDADIIYHNIYICYGRKWNVVDPIFLCFFVSGLILDLRPTNWRWRYFVNDVSHCLGASLESALSFQFKIWLSFGFNNIFNFIFYIWGPVY